MSNFPERFPLEPYDSEENKIAAGDVVRILKIPNWLLGGLDAESQAIITSCEGTAMLIDEIDSYGYAWVSKVTVDSDAEYRGNSFCMEPVNLLKQRNI